MWGIIMTAIYTAQWLHHQMLATSIIVYNTALRSAVTAYFLVTVNLIAGGDKLVATDWVDTYDIATEACRVGSYLAVYEDGSFETCASYYDKVAQAAANL